MRTLSWNTGRRWPQNERPCRDAALDAANAASSVASISLDMDAPCVLASRRPSSASRRVVILRPPPGVQAAIEALLGGGLAVIPTDTVYGLAADAESEAAARVLYAAKGRDAIQPTAVVFGSVGLLLERVPRLPRPARGAVRALLPGPVTLVLPNPDRRYAWLNPAQPDAIGVRVPVLDGPGKRVLEALGALVATSANLPGGGDPRRLADVPAAIREAAAALVDGGELPGTPSTVLDVTGVEPRVLREGALPAREALERLREPLTDS
jgi:L-threonylcarbamoyladenylate synthase